MEPKSKDQQDGEEVQETKDTLLDLVISEGPLVALGGAVLAALGFGWQRRRRRSK